MEFDDQKLFITHEDWVNAQKNPFALATMLNTFNDVHARGGSVKLLMPDGSGIKRSLDRKSDITDLFNEAGGGTPR